MKKVDYKILSERKCVNCDKQLKQNLISKHPNATLCYKCNRLAKGKPAHHLPRRKRIEADLPVHHIKTIIA